MLGGPDSAISAKELFSGMARRRRRNRPSGWLTAVLAAVIVASGCTSAAVSEANDNPESAAEPAIQPTAELTSQPSGPTIPSTTDGQPVRETSEAQVNPGQGPIERTRAVRIESITTEGADLTIVNFVGGLAGDITHELCATDYELEVDEATTPPTVTVWQLEHSVPPQPNGSLECTAEGHPWALEQQWSSGPEQVRDGANGETQTVIDLREAD